MKHYIMVLFAAATLGFHSHGPAQALGSNQLAGKWVQVVDGSSVQEALNSCKVVYLEYEIKDGVPYARLIDADSGEIELEHPIPPEYYRLERMDSDTLIQKSDEFGIEFRFTRCPDSGSGIGNGAKSVDSGSSDATTNYLSGEVAADSAGSSSSGQSYFPRASDEYTAADCVQIQHGTRSDVKGNHGGIDRVGNKCSYTITYVGHCVPVEVKSDYPYEGVYSLLDGSFTYQIKPGWHSENPVNENLCYLNGQRLVYTACRAPYHPHFLEPPSGDGGGTYGCFE